MAIYGIHAVEMGDVDLTQVTDCRISAGLAELVLRAGGQIDPTFVAIGKASPLLTVTTTELKRVLDKMATPWYGLGFTSSDDPVIAYFQKHLAAGVRSTISDFISVTITDGLLVPRTMAWQDGQPATIAFDVFPAKSDGSNVVTVATGVANPSITMTTDQIWTAGPLKVNTATLSTTKFLAVQSGNLDFGIEVERIGGDGHIYDQFVSILSRQPVLTAQLTDETSLTELCTGGEMIGKAQTVNDSKVFLRKMLANGTRVAAETAEHIFIAMDDGIIVPDNAAATAVAALSTGIRLLPAYDGSNPLLNFSTTTAIA